MVTEAVREARFELVELAEDLGPLGVVVDDHKVKAFAFTQDDYGSWYFDSSPFGPRIGHASILANDLLNIYYARYRPAIGLHTEEQLSFKSPVFVGERVTIRGRYTDKYVKRGNGYVVLESEAVGEDGRLLATHRGIEIMEIETDTEVGTHRAEVAGPRVTCETRVDLAPVSHASPGLTAGAPLVPIRKRIEQDQASVYSYCGVFQRNIHNDLEVAHRARLDHTIMQGQQGACYVAEFMTTFFGAAWFTSGWMRVKFIEPVEPGQTLSVHGAVGEYDDSPDGVRLNLDVWIRNEAGAIVTVGWANAEIPGQSSGHHEGERQ